MIEARDRARRHLDARVQARPALAPAAQRAVEHQRTGAGRHHDDLPCTTQLGIVLVSFDRRARALLRLGADRGGFRRMASIEATAAQQPADVVAPTAHRRVVEYRAGAAKSGGDATHATTTRKERQRRGHARRDEAGGSRSHCGTRSGGQRRCRGRGCGATSAARDENELPPTRANQRPHPLEI